MELLSIIGTWAFVHQVLSVVAGLEWSCAPLASRLDRYPGRRWQAARRCVETATVLVLFNIAILHLTDKRQEHDRRNEVSGPSRDGCDGAHRSAALKTSAPLFPMELS